VGEEWGSQETLAVAARHSHPDIAPSDVVPEAARLRKKTRGMTGTIPKWSSHFLAMAAMDFIEQSCYRSVPCAVNASPEEIPVGTNSGY
jgi:hypothetical protein